MLYEVITRVLALVIGKEAFDCADGNRIIDTAATTGLLAGMGADTAADSRQDIVPPDERQGLVVLTLCA